MVRASYEQKPYRKILMETWGAEVVPSPVDQPDHPGSLGLAISDAVRDAATRDDTHYSLGSVLNHVLLHQTVIGLEAKEQLALAGETNPDVVIGCCGGGSNLGGIALPFVPDTGVRLVAVEPSSCPTLTEGRFEYDFGDTAGMTPLLAMYTLGHEFVPPAIHAGGLRYHGDAPIISSLVKSGRMEAIAYPQGKTFEAAVQFARAEGKIAAPETGHAVRAAIDEALAAKETGEERVILFDFSGHGLLDLSAYDDFLNGRLSTPEHVADLVCPGGTAPRRSPNPAGCRTRSDQRCTRACPPSPGCTPRGPGASAGAVPEEQHHHERRRRRAATAARRLGTRCRCLHRRPRHARRPDVLPHGAHHAVGGGDVAADAREPGRDGGVRDVSREARERAGHDEGAEPAERRLVASPQRAQRARASRRSG